MAKSHRTYNKNNNPLKFEKSFKERLKQFKNVDAWSKEGIQLREDFAKEHGRAWWVFDSYEKVSAFKQRSWIEDYMIKERSK